MPPSKRGRQLSKSPNQSKAMTDADVTGKQQDYSPSK